MGTKTNRNLMKNYELARAQKREFAQSHGWLDKVQPSKAELIRTLEEARKVHAMIEQRHARLLDHII